LCYIKLKKIYNIHTFGKKGKKGKRQKAESKGQGRMGGGNLKVIIAFWFV
jgi:hypothetical protein